MKELRISGVFLWRERSERHARALGPPPRPPCRRPPRNRPVPQHPTPRLAGDVLRHLILPATTLIIVIMATYLKVMRNNMLEVMSSDYVRTARAKGLAPRVVNNKHARRNALLPFITLAGGLIVGLLGGSTITETIFAYPGIGQWFVQSALQLDIAGVMGFTLLIALMVVIMYTIVDILYAVLDPRIRLS